MASSTVLEQRCWRLCQLAIFQWALCLLLDTELTFTAMRKTAKDKIHGDLYAQCEKSHNQNKVSVDSDVTCAKLFCTETPLIFFLTHTNITSGHCLSVGLRGNHNERRSITWQADHQAAGSGLLTPRTFSSCVPVIDVKSNHQPRWKFTLGSCLFFNKIVPVRMFWEKNYWDKTLTVRLNGEPCWSFPKAQHRTNSNKFGLNIILNFRLKARQILVGPCLMSSVFSIQPNTLFLFEVPQKLTAVVFEWTLPFRCDFYWTQ